MLITKTQKLSLSNSRVESFRVSSGAFIVWDTKLPGFGVRVTAAGTKSYFSMHRLRKGGRQQKKTIGRHGIITCDQARTIAEGFRFEAWKLSQSPDIEAEDTRPSLTIAEVCQRYLLEHSKPNKKPGSYEQDKVMIEKIIVPEIGDVSVRDVERHQLASLHSKLSASPARANQVRALLSHVFSLCEQWGLREDGTNPMRHIKKNRIRARKRYCTAEEQKQLGQALKAYEKTNIFTSKAVQLLLLTGCRKGEVLKLRWRDIDFKESILALPDSKTGTKTVPIGSAAVALLKSIPRIAGNPYVFPGRIEGQRLTTIQNGWEAIRQAAGMPDLMIHDLRRNFATVGNNNNVSIHQLAGILGHSQTATTEKYAQRVGAELVKSADLIAAEIAKTAEINQHSEHP